MTNCTGKIIYHLAALNDKFNDYLTNPYNRTETLRRFSTGASLDEIASPQGDAAKKPDFTFEFINDANENERVVCEPHLKLPYNDNYPGDASYSTDRRVYFHEGKQNIQSGRILIGHIGHHL